MAYRLYITPAIGTATRADPRRPKYIADLGVPWGAMDYGFQPIFLAAADVTPAQHNSIAANADVTSFPADLSTTVGGGGVTAAQNALEAALVPAQWVNGAMQWAAVARAVAGMFQFMQRLNFYLGNVVFIDSSTKLNVQWSAIPVDTQQGILTSAQSLGYSFNPQPNDQLRNLLKTLSDQWGGKPFIIAGFTF